jgi:tetratricopeptide (TPR) repeat protein
VRANIIIQLCRLLFARSRFNDVLQLVQLARADLATHDLVLHARLCSHESSCYNALGNLEASARAAHQALALANQMIGLPISIVGEIRAQAEYELANHARHRRNLAEAMQHAQAALTFAREAKQARLANLCLMLIGGLFYDLGDLDESFQYRHDALNNLLAMGESYIAAYTLAHLADIHHLRLEDDAALEKLARASEMFRIIGDARGLASAESARATCLLWLNRIGEARAVIEKTVQELEGKGTEQMWGYRLNKLAMTQLAQGETDAAMVTLQRALALPATQSKPMMRFELHGTLAFAHAITGNLAHAQSALADAPRGEGLTRWVELDRALIEGYVALARGDASTARTFATQVSRDAEKFPLYRQNAQQLGDAIERALPVNEFPHSLWVGRELERRG